MGLFLINFNNQYDSNQTNDTVTARGKTRHTGLETQARYDLGTLTPTLDNVSIYASYAYVNAEIARKATPTAIWYHSPRNIKARWAWTTSQETGRSI